MRKIEIVPVAEVALPDEDVETGGLVPPPACKFKEPTLDLRAVRIDEVRAMMRRGMEYAEAVTLQAGYFGGESRMVMVAWTLLGVVAILTGIWLFYVGISSRSEHLPRGLVASRAVDGTKTLVAGLLLLCRQYESPRGTITTPRSSTRRRRRYFLTLRRRRAARHAFVVVGIWFGAISMATSVMWFVIPYDCQSQQQAASTLMFATNGFLFAAAVEAYAMRYSAATSRLKFACVFWALTSGANLPVLHCRKKPLMRTIVWASFAIIAAALGIYLEYRRRKNARDADQVVAADRSRYDELWERLTRGHEFVAKLDDLETAVGGAVAREATPLLTRPPVNGRRPSLEPNTPRAKALEKLGFVRKITGSRKPMQVIDDLPVLLAQAAALNQHFQGLVAARVGRGEHRVGAIKSRARAIEKLYRSYGGDASRLVDLVRTICKFDTLDDMISFVESLRGAPLVVVGSKNSLTTAFDSKESAGYRNINLSVIVVDAFTFSHGLDAHVSELQLGLKSIEALRDEVGHMHYIKWRDIKAE